MNKSERGGRERWRRRRRCRRCRRRKAYSKCGGRAGKRCRGSGKWMKERETDRERARESDTRREMRCVLQQGDTEGENTFCSKRTHSVGR